MENDLSSIIFSGVKSLLAGEQIYLIYLGDI